MPQLGALRRKWMPASFGQSASLAHPWNPVSDCDQNLARSTSPSLGGVASGGGPAQLREDSTEGATPGAWGEKTEVPDAVLAMARNVVREKIDEGVGCVLSDDLFL